MASAGQGLRVFRPKDRDKNKPKGVWIDRRSIGTMYVNGVPYTFNPELVANSYLEMEEKIEEYYRRRSKKKVIYIRRK